MIIDDLWVKENYNGEEEIALPKGIKAIKRGAFSGCKTLVSISIPNSVKDIEDLAFYNCSALKSITLPIEITSIGSETFKFCESLSDIIIPQKVKTIGEMAFLGCKSLQHIIIPEGVTEIGAWAFSDCINLSDCVLPNSLKEIGIQSFSGCKSLKHIAVPENIVKIEKQAFAGCNSLENIPSRYTKVISDKIASACEAAKIDLNEDISIIGGNKALAVFQPFFKQSTDGIQSVFKLLIRNLTVQELSEFKDMIEYSLDVTISDYEEENIKCEEDNADMKEIEKTSSIEFLMETMCEADIDFNAFNTLIGERCIVVSSLEETELGYYNLRAALTFTKSEEMKVGLDLINNELSEKRDKA